MLEGAEKLADDSSGELSTVPSADALSNMAKAWRALAEISGQNTTFDPLCFIENTHSETQVPSPPTSPPPPATLLSGVFTWELRVGMSNQELMYWDRGARGGEGVHVCGQACVGRSEHKMCLGK
jgi:hypothetical protein